MTMLQKILTFLASLTRKNSYRSYHDQYSFWS